jgi:hypothetical protein
MRPNLDRLGTFESPWEAWCDSIRVLIRVLQLLPIGGPEWGGLRGGEASATTFGDPIAEATSLRSPLATARMTRSVCHLDTIYAL